MPVIYWMLVEPEHVERLECEHCHGVVTELILRAIPYECVYCGKVCRIHRSVEVRLTVNA